eukprot:CAMPEP_0119334488 /NCGR_PEP_ID=MMETSP1333-20130426/87436_1 /TAXON_ID=418940 /ORGANISM="Scyphosphaera apsteinii, Strain RCC1455" /LENGTH=102 /DNA_ID=CAMNT_0007344789 /DNA_START=259 /DNA_END=563 /DNA_ORIENTATION=+
MGWAQLTIVRPAAPPVELQLWHGDRAFEKVARVDEESVLDRLDHGEAILPHVRFDLFMCRLDLYDTKFNLVKRGRLQNRIFCSLNVQDPIGDLQRMILGKDG